MKKCHPVLKKAEGNRTRGVGPFVFLFLLLIFLNFSCGSKKTAAPAEEKIPGKAPFLLAPSDGETVRDLEQSLAVFFRGPVRPEDFSFKIEPDPGGWELSWEASNRRLRLKHGRPFDSQRQYRVRLSLKGGPSLDSRFKTAAADPSALLESDSARGAITEDEAARARVMRLFDPQKAPEKYRYQRAPRSGTWDMLQVARRMNKLKPETVRELEPYLLRPDDPRSVFHGRLFGGAPALSRTGFSLVPAAYAAEPYVKETYRTDTGYTIEIYGERSVADTVRKARRLVEEYKIYENFQRLFHRATLDYGDRTLTIHVLSYLRKEPDSEGRPVEPMGVCYAYGWSPQSGLDPGTAVTWIAISAGQNKNDPDLASTLAHEIFHSFQFAFSGGEAKWLTEGTAVWAEDFIGRDWNTEQRRLSVQTFDPEEAVHNTITERAKDTAYGMYLFFCYLTRVRAGGGEFLMRRIWENCESGRGHSLESVKKVLNGDIRDVLKEYALFTLDVEQYQGKFPDAVNRYGGQNPLKLEEAHRLLDKWKISENGLLDSWIVHLPAMGAAYLKIQNEAQGMTAPAVRLDLSEFTERKEIGVQAVVKYRDGRVEKEDWTGLDRRIFCLSNKFQNFETIYLAVSWAMDGSNDKGWGDFFSLPLENASDTDCAAGEMRITFSVDGQEETERSSSMPGYSYSFNLTETWNRQVRFVLELTPQREEVTPEMEAFLKNLPKEAADQAMDEIRKPDIREDENTKCRIYIFRVKNCRVESFSGMLKETTVENASDAFGPTREMKTDIAETWENLGLSKDAEEWLKDKNLEVRVHVDPKTNRIIWVKPQGPVEIRCRVTRSLSQRGRIRRGQPPDLSMEDYSNSHSQDREEHIKASDVSHQPKDLPMNPDWKANIVTETGAKGEGKVERPLDKTWTGDGGGKGSTKGREIKKIEWELRVDLKK